ncbi:MAG: response regulator [[Clostridium] leptum]
MAYRVLIADDEEIIRQGIEFLVDWERLDCSIVERCANGQEVIRFLEQSPSGVDIIISDIRMAGADGLDIARYVSQNQIPVQVIFLTAYADFSYAKTAIEYSVTDFVLKSDISEGLPRAVEKAKALRPKAGGAEKEAGRRKAEPSEPALSSGEPAAERGAWHGAPRL